MEFLGTPSDEAPKILATGETDARYVFISLSAREPDGRDADYIEWHSFDHRPEQYRIAGIRNSMRLVSTPECRAARAASAQPYDAVDHVMTYQFTDESALPPFVELGAALDEAGRMELRLPSLGYVTGELAGKFAAPRAVAGADVLPWRPALGVYLMIERGHANPAALAEVPGVAGVWWFNGTQAPAGFNTDSSGLQMTYCYLDSDPVAVARDLGGAMAARWASGEVEGLLAAPFHVVQPFEPGRFLP
ncbi:MAG: hypothetical protein KDE55_18795 [Novosphingobium sp.]|nr:hypothetical protein [Novosphingobium sp.]